MTVQELRDVRLHQTLYHSGVSMHCEVIEVTLSRVVVRWVDGSLGFLPFAALGTEGGWLDSMGVV